MLTRLVLLMAACGLTFPVLSTPASNVERLYFIGQDLDALRGFYASDCCAKPDGVTAYLSLYRLLEGEDAGGLGYRADGTAIQPEASWGAGRVDARASIESFGARELAIGLFIAENDQPGGLGMIAGGEFDAEIDHLARFIDTVDGRVFLRVGYEFDGTWNHGQDNPETYKAAWRHIADRLRTHELDNLRLTWQAGASIIDDILEKRHEDIRDWYPGDNYVDWMALSWFMAPDAMPAIDTDGYVPASSGALAMEVVDFARERGKPVLIAESTPQGYDIEVGFKANIGPMFDGVAGENRQHRSSSAIWNEYYAPLFAFMNDHADVVRGLAYINVDWNSQPMWGPPYTSGYWGDSRLEANPWIAAKFDAAVAAWKALPR